MGHDDYRWASWGFVMGWDKWVLVKLGTRGFGDDLRWYLWAVWDRSDSCHRLSWHSAWACSPFFLSGFE
jgi:hypothetical protein